MRFLLFKGEEDSIWKKENRFYLTIGMILILHLTACTNRSSELPAPDSTVLDMREKQKSYLMECARNIMIKKKRIKCFANCAGFRDI